MAIADHRFVAALALVLAGCGGPESKRATYADYQLDLPPGFVRDGSGVGIDSKVERWVSPDAEISTDFGQHGSALTCSEIAEPCAARAREVDGEPASVTRFGPDVAGDWRVRVFVPLDVVDKRGRRWPLSLVLDARCGSEARCDELVPVLLAARLIPGPPPWEHIAPPPPR